MPSMSVDSQRGDATAPSTRLTTPGPGEATLPAGSVAALLRRNTADPDLRDRVAVRFDDLVWTHATFVRECRRFAALLQQLRPERGPFHLGVLLDNTPDYLVALGGSALVGATLVGLNDTRRGAELARDIHHTDVGILLTEPEKVDLVEPILDGLGIPGEAVLTTRRFSRTPDDGRVVGRDLASLLDSQPDDDPGPQYDPELSSVWCLVLTSGTSGAPKAVICSQRRMLQTGERMRQLLGVTRDDVGYISMPLFHSNSLMVGLMPALVAGASVGLARRFTASGWLHDVRRYGATYFNYTGKPLSYIVATEPGPDDADNPVRRAFGNEGSPEVQRQFAERFAVEVIDMFGPTEGGIGLTPDDDTPSGALGRAGEHIMVVDEDGEPLRRARLDERGVLKNPDECVGEIVNTAGGGPFEGYYNNDEANRRATRNGWYWTGDLGYVDEDGFLYFAGRTADWLRVDGENFPAGPIERILSRHPDVVLAAVYGVPDTDAGDQVMAALQMREVAAFDPREFAHWLDEQPDLGPKWRPRYLRIARELPRTATNKIVTRELRRQKVRLDEVGDDTVYVRDRGVTTYRRFTSEDEDELHGALSAAGRERFWDI